MNLVYRARWANCMERRRPWRVQALMTASEGANEKALLDTVAWLTRQRFFTGRNEVIARGADLERPADAGA